MPRLVQCYMAVASTKWQDWASFVLGLWLALSPWAAGYHEHEAATMNAIFVGLGLALASHFECVACDDMPVEWLNLAVGLWLVWAPFTFEMGSARGDGQLDHGGRVRRAARRHRRCPSTSTSASSGHRAH